MKSNINYSAKLGIHKSLLKEYSNNEYSRIVYMKDGQEFQIYLFNPYKYSVGVDILLNGSSLNNKIVLRPGESVWVERYLDSPRKFLFNTYFVNGNNKDVQEAIAKNGFIEINFYREKEFDNNWLKISLENIPVTGIPVTYQYQSPNDGIKYKYTTTSNSIYTSCSSCSGDDNINSITTSTSTIPFNSSIDSLKNAKEYSNKLETGRIERGGYSKQKFGSVMMDFEPYPFKCEKIKILPESEKQISPNDLKKIYCHQCGHKIKDKFKFCPYCGAKLL